MSKESGQRINQKFSCIANEFDDKDSCNSSDALSIWQKEDAQGNIYYDGYCWSCNQSFSEHQVHNSSTTCSMQPNKSCHYTVLHWCTS